VPSVAELIDQGVKAYARGEVAEAERCFSEALALDPRNERAGAYLRQLRADPSPAPAAARSPWDDGPASAATIVIDPEEGLELRAVEEKSDIRSLVPERKAEPHARSKKEIDVWMQGARELFALGDFSGSLEMIEKILRLEPDHAEARAYLKQNEATLIAMYESKLGPLTGVPRLAISPEEVMWLNLDHRAGFLLAQVDGTVNYDELFALSGLPRLDTARILASLLADGVIR
jgi:tetratricopeptide (TPR) repeat protein